MAGLALDSASYGLDDSGVGLDDQFGVDLYFSELTNTTFSISAASHVTGTAKLVVTANAAAQPSNATFDASSLSAAATPSNFFTITNTGGTAGAEFRAWVQINNSGTRSTQSILGSYTSMNYILKLSPAGLESSASDGIFVLGISSGLVAEIGESSASIVAGKGKIVITNDSNLISKPAPSHLRLIAKSGKIIATTSDELVSKLAHASIAVDGGKARVTASISDDVNVIAGASKHSIHGHKIRVSVEQSGNIDAQLGVAKLASSTGSMVALIGISDNLIVKLKSVEINAVTKPATMRFGAIFPTVKLNNITLEI